MSIEAMKMALEALEDVFGKEKVDVGAINALRQAIEQAEKQEPVAWIEKDTLPLTHIIKAVVRREKDEQYVVPLYTAPPKREWVGLTDEERFKISRDTRPYIADTMRAHEEELKRRNT
jgi:hypothetical protein